MHQRDSHLDINHHSHLLTKGDSDVPVFSSSLELIHENPPKETKSEHKLHKGTSKTIQAQEQKLYIIKKRDIS